MSTLDQVAPRYQIGQTIVEPLPEERAYPLTRDQYDLLEQGNVSNERQTRDVFLGFLVGSVIGLLSLVGTDAVHWMRFAVLLALAFASAFCAGLFAIKVWRAPMSPGCSRVKTAIDRHFGR
jgi:hypothetical protein